MVNLQASERKARERGSIISGWASSQDKGKESIQPGDVGVQGKKYNYDRKS